VGDRSSRTRDNGVGVAQGLYRPGPMRVPYWDRCDLDDDGPGRRSPDPDDTLIADDAAVDGLADVDQSSSAA